MKTKTLSSLDFVAGGSELDFWLELESLVKVRTVLGERHFDLDTPEVRVGVGEFFWDGGSLPTVHEFTKHGVRLRATLMSYEDHVAVYEIVDVENSNG